MNNDKAVGFYINKNCVLYELVENFSSWSVYENNEEVFEGGYRRALQIMVARIGFGDIH